VDNETVADRQQDERQHSTIPDGDDADPVTDGQV
jgi:hypothetical protein